uniref:KRR1 small subunit processome component homolog n=1 Tax=Fragaria vesca subsp. vesca TaxID=101020 RepID=UPI0005C9CEBB|nr:PREDICTED: KRR1 small subunit processome component homolog [Fragaria vesca subsp. vesca]
MLYDYPNTIVLELEEAIPLMINDAIEVISYIRFYDEFLNTDVLQKTWPIVESSKGSMVSCAREVFQQDGQYEHEIIKIGNLEGGICDLFGINNEQFLARRNLLVGVIQELFELAGCGIFLKGNTIAVIGSLQGIKMITKIVEDCIAHDVPPAPRARRIKKKTRPKKDARIKMTSEVMMSLARSIVCVSELS